MKKQDIFELISYGLKKDDDNFRKKVEYIIEEEKTANHIANVNYLEKILDTRITRFLNQNNGYFDNSINENMVKDIVYTKIPVKTLNDIELPNTIRQIVEELTEEQQKAKELEEHGLSPRSKILLEGPPGNGKTCLAEAIANTLNYPFLLVRQEQLIDSLLGKTAKNLYKALSYAVKQPCVFFIDEFDAIASQRNQTTNDSGEMNRIVNSILTELEALPSYVIFIVATNRANCLDKALWRRFQVTLKLPMPTTEELTKYYKKYIEKHNITLNMEPTLLAETTYPCSYANAEELMITLHRKIILHKETFNIKKELEQWETLKNIRKI